MLSCLLSLVYPEFGLLHQQPEAVEIVLDLLVRLDVTVRDQQLDLFEGLQDLLPLREVPEEQLEGAGDEGRVVVHPEVEEDAQEGLAAGAVEVEDGALLAAAKYALGLRADRLQVDLLDVLLAVTEIVKVLACSKIK